MTETVRIPARGGAHLGAWFFSGGPGKRACVVMGCGLGMTRRTALAEFAKHFQALGVHAIAFDYRGFGDSDGEPRQLIAPEAQLDDWASAIAFARNQNDVYPDRVALWGASYSGGAVVIAAARDRRIAAVSAMVPMMDARCAARDVVRREGWGLVGRSLQRGAADLARALLGGSRVYVPIVGPPGSLALMTAPGDEEAYRAIAGADWTNEACAQILVLGGSFRPVTYAARLPCPILIQIAERDRTVPNDAAERVAALAGAKATVIRYPNSHFEPFAGEVLERFASDQVSFFEQYLDPPSGARMRMASGVRA
jgi:alpha-beta hydrolase superfamily lysophospholipase